MNYFHSHLLFACIFHLAWCFIMQPSAGSSLGFETEQMSTNIIERNTVNVLCVYISYIACFAVLIIWSSFEQVYVLLGSLCAELCIRLRCFLPFPFSFSFFSPPLCRWRSALFLSCLFGLWLADSLLLCLWLSSLQCRSSLLWLISAITSWYHGWVAPSEGCKTGLHTVKRIVTAVQRKPCSSSWQW